MAKKYKVHPGWLFIISACLLSAGWLMKSFPVLIFAAIAPLFAIQDHARDNDRFWSLTELILGSLAVGLFAARLFEMQYLANSLVQAIILSLAFVSSSFAHQRLGNWAGHFTTIIFWIAIEYAVMKSPWSGSFLLLGDVFTHKTEWLGWTQ